MSQVRILVLILSLFCSPIMSIANDDNHSPRFLIHLLDYLAKDYGGAVANGKILSQGEYDEQVEFSDTTLETNSKLTETKKDLSIEKDLRELNKLIHTKASPEKVSSLARSIQQKVMLVSNLEVSPQQWPSLKRGSTLFAQNCTSCHGENGAGDGPAGTNLDPKPANFLSESMNELSPFQAFNTIRMGVPGTGMPPFHTLSDKEVWDLAFFLVSLRHKEKPANASQVFTSELEIELLKQVATSSDVKLESDVFKNKDDKVGLLTLAMLRTHSNDDENGSGGSLQIAESKLGEALKAYENGDAESAKTKALSAYLEGIEPIEPRLKASDPEAVIELETKMAAVRSAIESKKSPLELKSLIDVANAAIQEAKSLITEKEMSPWIAFLAAAAIILREGFEAVLIVIALLGVIRAAGSRKAALWVHGGWGAALGLGVIAWFFSGWLMNISGAQREFLEGATSLFAVAVLLVVGFWLHSQTEIGRWKAFIHGKVQKALEGKNLFALASIAFIGVFREAFETVLFLRAIWLEGGDQAKFAMTSGVVLSILLVIGLAWAILKYSARVPIRRLFEASAVIMAALALILTGKGFHSLQETGMLSVTTPPINFRFDLLGLYPTWETIISQAAILLLVTALWIYGKKPTAPVSVK